MTELEKTDSYLYKERVLPGFGTFAAAFVLFPSIVIVAEPFDLIVGLVIGALVVSVIWGLLFIGSPLIVVTTKELKVGRVSVPRGLIGKPIAITKDGIFAERGPNLDPAAHKVFQGTIKTAIKIPINDREDPTPYWLVSTRSPEKMAEILTKA